MAKLEKRSRYGLYSSVRYSVPLHALDWRSMAWRCEEWRSMGCMTLYTVAWRGIACFGVA